MTAQEQRLATALRDLCGWHQGMMTEDGRALVRVVDIGIVLASGASDVKLVSSKDRTLRPALDAPANWGVWLAWAKNRWPYDDVSMGFDEDGAWFRVGRHLEDGRASLPRAAMLCFTRALGAALAEAPPSVLAWWEAEQGGESDE